MTGRGDLSSFRTLVRGPDVFLARQEVIARLKSGALLRGGENEKGNLKSEQEKKHGAGAREKE